VLGIIFVFTLGNASDAFLLLRLSDAGVPAVWIPILWSLLHVVKSASSVLGGAWSDRVGRRWLIVSGWFLYAVVYASFAAFDSPRVMIATFIVYGLYFGLTEGTERALVADLAPAALRGTAYGTVVLHMSPEAAAGGALALVASALLAAARLRL